MFKLPNYINEILERLNNANHEAYVVGGAVRDMVRGIEPNDYDITTNCTPDEIENLFIDKKLVKVGKKYGTIIVLNNGEDIEITTYRSDGEYIDGRRPDKVEFSSKLEDDLKRRDFTINALAYNNYDGLIDLYGGLSDIENKIIKAVGDPYKRFNEDYLRILRGIRFASQLQFNIEKNTIKAMKKNSRFINLISSERIRKEFFLMILSDKPSNSIRLLDEIGILKILFPEIYNMKKFNQRTPFHTMDLYEHSLCVMDNTDARLEQRLGGLFHDIGKLETFSIDDKTGIGHFYGHSQIGTEMTIAIMKRLKASNILTEDVSNIVHYHMNNKDEISLSGLKRLLNKFGKNIDNLFKVQMADTICSNNIESNIERIKKREIKIKEIINGKEPYNRKDLQINGNDLIEVGYKEGRVLGEILEYLFDLVLEDKNLNKKDILIEKAREKFVL